MCLSVSMISRYLPWLTHDIVIAVTLTTAIVAVHIFCALLRRMRCSRCCASLACLVGASSEPLLSFRVDLMRLPDPSGLGVYLGLLWEPLCFLIEVYKLLNVNVAKQPIQLEY